MSRRPVKSTSKEQVRRQPSLPKTQASARASATSGVAGRSSVASKGASVKSSTSAAPKEKKEFELPALSVYKPKVTTSEFEKLKKKTIRRSAPPGEDLKCMKEILKNVRKQKITVHEFISLIAPSTGDQGEVLRSVMQDDLNTFRRLARKVYDTITQDNSDVLLNQQLQLAEFYKERKILLENKMMKFIEEIYTMAPKFDFDRYANEKERYLVELFPIPAEVNIEPEELEMMKRQAAYHRLQWLRSEGERLNEENNSLKNRLNQLKHTHKDEQARMMQKEKAAEAKKEALEATEAEKTETLEMLTESLEKSFIGKEQKMRVDKDKVLLEPRKKEAMKKKSKGKIKRRPPWNQEAAKELESKFLEESHVGEVATAMGEKSQSMASGRSAGARQPSPRRPASPEGAHYVSPPRPTQRPPTAPASQQRYGRRASQGPKDTWRGFF